MKVMLTVIIDGVNREIYEKLLKTGKLPAIEELTKNAVNIRNCYSSFPSATVTGHTSIATSALPSSHGIVGQAWFDRQRREYIGYDFELTMPDNWVDAKVNLNDRHILGETWFHRARRLGFKTFSADLVRKGADLKMSFILPGEDKDVAIPKKLFFLRRFAKHTSVKKTNIAKKLLLKAFPFHVLQHEIVTRNAIKAVKAGFNFGIIWFMETDASSHIYGPESMEGVEGKPYIYDSFEDAMRDADEEIAKLKKELRDYELYINITTDHGQSRLGDGEEYHISLSAEMESQGINAFTRIDPHEYETRVGRRAHVVVAPSGPRMAHIYLLDQRVAGDARDFLRECKAVEFVFWREGKEIFVDDGGEVSRLEEYEFSREHPRAAERVRGLLESKRSGDFVVTAKKGYEFQVSSYKGAHGGLNAEDSTGFAVIHGERYKEEWVEEGLISDVLRIAMEWFENS